MEVSERIHIAPLGFEYDRIILPAKKYQADRTVLLDYIADDTSRPGYHEEVIADLESAGIRVERRDCDLFDLYESIATISAEAVQNSSAGNRVYVNLSTGSKITAIGGMIACMVTEAAIPYYVRAEEYGSGMEPMGRGMEFATRLPRYPMQEPDSQWIAVLAYLSIHKHIYRETPETYDIRKEDLIEFGKINELPFAADYDGETTKGYYRRLDRHILNPLVQRGYITIKQKGRSKRIHPTETGYNTAKAFGYLLQGKDLETTSHVSTEHRTIEITADFVDSIDAAELFDSVE